MAQITSGIRSVLNHPRIYDLVQSLLGAHEGRTQLVRDFIRAEPNDLILDIGCGPAEILNYLPEVEYWGFDISPAYIARAKTEHPNRTHFFQKTLSAGDLAELPRFDIALAIGVLHHLDDDTARSLFQLAHACLRPGGRFVTVDPCYADAQNPLARFLISRDRGQNVRSRDLYQALVPNGLFSLRTEIRHRAWVPYTHCYMECTRT